MDGMIYTAMNSAQQILLKQTLNSHNLANANTTGFKATVDRLTALPVYGPGKPTRVITEANQVGTNFETGVLQYTGRDLDIAIQGEGFIAVEGLDGKEAFTRAGNLKIDVNGFLKTAKGNIVYGNGGLVALPPFEKLDIATDGTVSIIPTGQAANTVSAIDRIKLVNPDASVLERGPDGLFYHKEGLVTAPDANVTLATGSLEGSNVNVIEGMVNMIELARAFEINTKLMRLTEDNDAATTELMKLNG